MVHPEKHFLASGGHPDWVGTFSLWVGGSPTQCCPLILLPARAHSEHEASREQALHVDGPSLCCNQRGQRSLSSSLSVLGQRRRQRRPDSQLVLPPWSVVRGSSSRGISNARFFLPALFFSCSLARWVGASPTQCCDSLGGCFTQAEY